MRITNPSLLCIMLLASTSACSSGPQGAATTTPISAAGSESQAPSTVAADDPLPSWKDTAHKRAIMQFVADVSTVDGRHFVPAEDRIAVLDNDGTLWVEQPTYAQLQFAIDRVKALSSSHPEWKRTQPFKAVLEDDQQALAASGHEGLFELINSTHAGMTTEQFQFAVQQWLSSAKHPRFDRSYDELTYGPMVELLRYLRAHGFKTFIVSGGGVDFVRVFAEEAYGIPPEQVIGSAMVTEYKIKDGTPVIERQPDILYIDDKELKPVLIERIIGRRPILAVGNSDGDLQMLQWSTAGAGKRLGVLVHHTDAEREYRYDRESSVGRLDEALDLAAEEDWIVVDMKSDWERVFTVD